MLKFTEPKFIRSDNIQALLRTQIQEQLIHFYKELQQTIEKNTICDFEEWFSERTLLSIFFNAQIRGDNNYSKTVIQEYCTTDKVLNKHGRCDGFMKDNDSVILYEAKFYKYYGSVPENHFDLELWITWDQTDIRVQLEKYLACDHKFFLEEKRYRQCYLTTIVFKIIKEIPKQFIERAEKELQPASEKSPETKWYYSVAFFGAEEINKDVKTFGIEVYGTTREHSVPL